MFRYITVLLLFGGLLLGVQALHAQNDLPEQESTALWQLLDESRIAVAGRRVIIPDRYLALALDRDLLQATLRQAPAEFDKEAHSAAPLLALPLPDGSFRRFRLYETALMQPGLAATFPEFKTYIGQGVDDPADYARLDWTSQGFHAMLLLDGETVYIDPYAHGNRDAYIVYSKNGLRNVHQASFKQLPPIDERGVKEQLDAIIASGAREPSGSELRTYRLAVAATVEYTAFHGGKTDAMAAIVTAINRVSGVYERDVAVRLVLVDNNEDIVFDIVDAYENDNGTAMLVQNQAVIDSIIGPLNYDVGHVFSTGGGGVAFLGVPCVDARKAGGVTGLPAPTGDPFYIDYVAHELGHQFGANHTFNGDVGSCSGGNRNASTAYEPGSGTTIMAYAGICGVQNIQSNSDDHFHTASYDEIVAYTTQSDGNSCPVITASGNTPPVADAGEDFVIPVNTPFELSGSATDADNDPLSYNWEQFDRGPAGHPNEPSGDAPLFRSFSSRTTPVRILPQISDILSNTQTIGELLPTYARTLNFRLTVRDNHVAPAAGGVDHDEMQVEVVATAGPFVVTSPNTVETWVANTSETVTWDIANTSAAPISCANVAILLSLDGGMSFPVTLRAATPNDGEQAIVVPNQPTTSARIKVACSDNIFFDISDENVTIEAAATPSFTLNVTPQQRDTCAPDPAVFNIALGSILGFAETVTLDVANLPDELSAGFSDATITPPGSSQLQLEGAVDQLQYSIDIVGVSATAVQSATVVWNVSTRIAPPELEEPANGATALGESVSFRWSGLFGATFHFELAADPQFNEILYDVDGISATTLDLPLILALDEDYYWRVTAFNGCGDAVSEIGAFTTALLSCESYAATVLPFNVIEFPAPNISTLDVEDSATIFDVDVIDLVGSHSWINDLTFTLDSPGGSSVEIMSRSCGNEDNFDLNLDDEAAGTWPCPPIGGGTYQPSEPLATFDGEDRQGTWTLTIDDSVVIDNGQLDGWGLRFCANADADFSDAEPEYGVAWHSGDGAVRVGDAWDADSSSAEGQDDDTDDGISFSDTLRNNRAFTLTVSSSGAGGDAGVVAWFDWNGDGDFSDAGEQALSGSPDQPLTATVPSDAILGDSVRYRVRLYPDVTAVTPAPTGAAGGGEVTDGLAAAQPTVPTAVSLQQQSVAPSALLPLLLLLLTALLLAVRLSQRRRQASG